MLNGILKAKLVLTLLSNERRKKQEEYNIKSDNKNNVLIKSKQKVFKKKDNKKKTYNKDEKYFALTLASVVILGGLMANIPTLSMEINRRIREEKMSSQIVQLEDKTIRTKNGDFEQVLFEE